MPERRWGAIANGATFEALATTVVFFEDPTAALFGRRGKDGGQDARSGDGMRVFQAKHHESGAAARAISDAKSEAEKVKEYRKPGHARHEQWSGVTHWRLVTNAAFNPTDKLTWDREVVPLFRQQGLTADYWERATLDALLDKHPEIHRSFFENETRVFLSMPEIKERLPSHEPFLRRDSLGTFCGRAAEKAIIREFLASSKQFIVVHGAGGTGKTRLLVEAGDEIASDGEWQVLWANVESMATTSAWFEAVVPERATLLLVDEPTNETLLQQLAEQFGGRLGRTARWKVAVSVRSPKDPVLRFLRGARRKSHVEELPLASLTPADAEAMCFELLRTGRFSDLAEADRREVAQQLSTRFARFPVWLTLAVQHLEAHGHLKQIPVDARDLADEYLLEIERSQSEMPAEAVRDALRWVALVGPVNREDDATVGLIRDYTRARSVSAMREQLASLVRRRALIERGAHNRLVEVKPDVLRDHILLRWLSTDVGGADDIAASGEANELLEQVLTKAFSASLSGLDRAILIALARTEFLLRLSGNDLHLLPSFFAELEAALPSMSATQRLALAGLVEAVAVFHPQLAASLARKMRLTPVLREMVEGLFGTKVVGQSDILLSLAWPLFHGAMGAETSIDREAVLRELCALTEAEADLAPTLPRGLPNDGKRAAVLVTRVIHGGPQFWSDYDDTARTLCFELITMLEQKPPSPGQTELLKSLVEPVLSLERQQSWSNDRSVTWRTVEILPETPAWSTREDVLARVKKVLAEENSPIESRIQLWHVLSRVRDDNDLDKLSWTYGVLTTRSTTIKELTAAREVWEWYCRYEKAPELKAAADALEALYVSNDLAREFQTLLPDIENYQEHHERTSAKAAELAQLSTPNDIVAFFDRAETFLGSDHALFRLGDVAWSLGEHAESREVVRAFIQESLQSPSIDPRTEVFVAAAVRWVTAVRRVVPERAHQLVLELLCACGSDERRAHLLERIYSRVPKLSDAGAFTTEERALLRDSRDLFTGTGRDASFISALGLSVAQEWPGLKPLLEDVLQAVPVERLPHSMRALVDAVYWAFREDAEAQPPSGLSEWLMSQLLALPDINELGGNGGWHLNEILKRLGQPDVRWLLQALHQRKQQESAIGAGMKYRAVSYNTRISEYVRKIDSTDASNPEITASLGNILDFVHEAGSVGYYLPEILRDVDPSGLVVPKEVEARVTSVTDVEGLRRLARIGGAYAVNSKAWRRIALATIRAATRTGQEAKHVVYSSLGERGVRSWSNNWGEVPSIFIAALDEARAALDAEDQDELRPYWQQRIGIAETELREQEEFTKEERGE